MSLDFLLAALLWLQESVSYSWFCFSMWTLESWLIFLVFGYFLQSEMGFVTDDYIKPRGNYLTWIHSELLNWSLGDYLTEFSFLVSESPLISGLLFWISHILLDLIFYTLLLCYLLLTRANEIFASDVCIVGVARTPMGGLLGSLSSLPATKLGSIAIECKVTSPWDWFFLIAFSL